MSQISRRNLITAGSGITLAAAIGLVRPAWAQQGTVVMGDAYSVMASDDRLTTWTQLIDAGGLQAYARAPRPYTTFPTSDAVFAQNPAIVKQLLGYLYSTGTHNSQDAFPDTTTIVKLVRSHVVAGKHYSPEVMGKKITVQSIAGTPIEVDGTNPKAVKVTWTSAANGKALSATLVDDPITCTNAVIYIVDAVEWMG